MVGRERGQGQLGFAGELPENGNEEGEGTWRIPWSILRREQWLGRGSVAFAYQNSCRFCASIRFYRDIGSSFGHWSGHGKNLFIISISGCGHGTAAVGPDRAGGPEL